MTQPTIQSIQIQEAVKRAVEEAMERKKINQEISDIDKELDNIHLFRDILGIRYIPTVDIINPKLFNVPYGVYEKKLKGWGRPYGY